MFRSIGTYAPEAGKDGTRRCGAVARGLLRAFRWLLVAALAGFVSACTEEPAETRLRDRIGMMHAAAEYRATGVFMGGVAEDFAGNQGIDRDALLGLMRFHFLRNEKVSIVLGPISVEIQGDRATAQFELVLLGGNQALLPERARALDVKTGWRDVDGEWFVYYAEWKPVF